ncbi:hypothetical protein HTIA_1642 [Halorhabdus tiamatea SARL4B]|uniref:Uncharacterized protein n=1 Tax=Halorhabdus tiamatea SARL4B TaxID=1033806 RepID=F7PNJ2_9EURY|nr:hypothetical protein HTIA_1642 [Halorhabdus tiamatea SARL4B]
MSDSTVSQSVVLEFVDGVENVKKLRYQTIDAEGISMSQLAEFIESSDGYAARLANDLGGGKLAGAIELDPADRDILTEVAYKESLDGKDALASDSLTARDILDMSEDTDLQSVKMIAKSQGGKVIRLESGQDSFDHILDRHFRGTAIKSSGEQTTFFPSGKTASARGGGPEADLPSEVSQDQIAPLLREAIEETSTTDGSFTVTFSQPRSGITKLNIETGGDLIASAYPKEGPEVRRWNWDTGEWEQWSSPEWTRWEKPYNQAGNSNQPSMTPGPLPTNPSQQHSHLTTPSASQELTP